MKIRLIPVFFLAVSLCMSGCMFRTHTTVIRGYVHADGKPVHGAEVRIGVAGNEQTVRTNFDGRFSLVYHHRPTQEVEVKVLNPGFVHNEIRFPALTSGEQDLDVELKRVFNPSKP